MNNSTCNSTPDATQILVHNILRIYFQPLICVFGFTTNIINALVFAKSGLKENIFIYYLALSINDLILIINKLMYLLLIEILAMSKSSYTAVFYINYGYFVILSNFNTVSSLIQIAISLEQLFLMKNKEVYFKSPSKSLAAFYITSTLTYIVSVAMLTIKEYCQGYVIGYNEFGNFFLGIFIFVLLGVVKNIALIMFLFIVNLILAGEVRKFYERKKQFFKPINSSQASSKTTGGTSLPQQTAEQSVQRAKFAKMTVILFVLYFISNIPYSVLSVCTRFYSGQDIAAYLTLTSCTVVYIPAALNMFIHYHFNSRYKKIFLKLFARNRIESV